MNRKCLKLVTRQSPLALWQSLWVKQALENAIDGLTIELVKVVTDGDRWLDSPLYNLGGKALFVKALEEKLLNKEVDFAVHSLKDMPAQLPPGLTIGAICERADPSDSFVSYTHNDLASLPEGAVVGTSSLRRQCQLLNQYPHLTVKPIRGNVGTRLQKCQSGEFDAIILATAGLNRLELMPPQAQALPIETFVPAPGQGALAIECRSDDKTMLHYLKQIHHRLTAKCVLAERAMNAALEGGCHVPIAGHATVIDEQLRLVGLIGSLDGRQLISSVATHSIKHPEVLGQTVAQALIAQGAKQIIKGSQT